MPWKFDIKYINLKIFILNLIYIYSNAYKSNIYIYLLTLYNSFILDIEHSPNYITLGLPQTHKVN